MGRVLSNNVQLSYAAESSVGVQPTSGWKKLEPNTITKYGADIKTVERTPISSTRQRKKGTIIDLDSAVEFDADYTMDQLTDFLEGFAFATAYGTSPFRPTAVTSTDYTVASGGALAQNTLIFAQGFSIAGNNGLKVVGASSTGTAIKTSGLTAEASPPASVLLEVAGVQGASGDITVDASGNILSTVLDFTTLGLKVGQTIWIGGDTTITKFAQAANRGYARISAITATKLTLDKRSQAFVADTGSGKTIQLFFGRFIKNVPVDDAKYIERSYHFELTYPNLQNPGPGDMYEYAQGNYANTMAFDLPLSNKATIAFGFIGTDTPAPTATRATGASSGIAPIRTTALNTTSDIARLRITQVDETGLTTDFKTLKLTLNNNVSPEKVLSVLGARYMNAGIFEVNIEADLLFTNSAVADAIRANTTLTMDFAVRNDNGALHVDIPSLTLGGGGREYPVNESVRIKTTATAFGDAVLGTSIGLSLFPYAPAS